MSDSTAVAVIPANSFDYSMLDTETARFLRDAAIGIRVHNGITVRSIIKIGTDLLAVKERLEHGKFLDWIEAEFAWSASTAGNYMRAATVFGGNSQPVANLAPATVYRLARKSTPPAVMSTVIERAQAGEIVPDRRVAAMIREATFKARIDRKAERARERRSASAKLGAERKREREAGAAEREAQNAKVEAKELAALVVAKLGAADARRFDRVAIFEFLEALRGEIILAATPTKPEPELDHARAADDGMRMPAEPEFEDIPAFLDRRGELACT